MAQQTKDHNYKGMNNPSNWRSTAAYKNGKITVKKLPSGRWVWSSVFEGVYMGGPASSKAEGRRLAERRFRPKNQPSLFA